LRRGLFSRSPSTPTPLTTPLRVMSDLKFRWWRTFPRRFPFHFLSFLPPPDKIQILAWYSMVVRLYTPLDPVAIFWFFPFCSRIDNYGSLSDPLLRRTFDRLYGWIRFLFSVKVFFLLEKDPVRGNARSSPVPLLGLRLRVLKSSPPPRLSVPGVLPLCAFPPNLVLPFAQIREPFL